MKSVFTFIYFKKAQLIEKIQQQQQQQQSHQHRLTVTKGFRMSQIPECLISESDPVFFVSNSKMFIKAERLR